MSGSRSEQTPGTVTRLLQELCAGRQEAFDELVPHVYDELRRLAHRERFGEREGHTLTTTALVHEAFLKLFPAGDDTPAEIWDYTNGGVDVSIECLGSATTWTPAFVSLHTGGASPPTWHVGRR